MVCSSFTPLLAAALLASNVVAKPSIHPSVPTKLRAQGTVDLILTMKSGVALPLASVRNSKFATRGEKLDALVARLEGNAKDSQKSVDALLAQDALKPNRYKFDESFWISNQRLVRGVSSELLARLAGSDDIEEIREEVIVPPPQVQAIGINTTAVAASPTAVTEWGVNQIGAPSVWALGFRGQNVVIGSIDTGVLTNHAALLPNWRSSYGWYDATAKRKQPYDDLGHGTHTVGTIVGLNGIGVAPAAKFIACKACAKNGCSEADLLSCAQFMTCPTNSAGASRDCSKAPDLVSNSWGGGQGSTYFSAAIAAWQTAGIIPVFANGNNGPACRTANSPGDNANVIAVGATDVKDGLASFSSKGPSVGGLVKPEISAPGVAVRSAWNSGTTSYTVLSGTSMATPHVAGAIALLLSKKPTLTYEQVKSALTGTAVTSTLLACGVTCGSTSETTFPNNQFGYGRVNALAAIARVAL